ncbi:PREDICTED: DNA ligase 1-like [Lupinus angustifolius]|uniref:DNA ligase 1-like n=1 Tax=Lupinus angustifolius TaxID=3871 RepID=UPI00092EA3EA|nr:PREDICTED: DNA ligase 1-like [Lupinus angustifolius]
MKQIHYLENGSVEVYSRNAERNTGKFPDVVAAVSRLKKSNVSSFILDCELVAYDRAKKKILPFQVLSTRARKNVAMNDIKVDVCIFSFDLLYLNGKALLQENLKIRRESKSTEVRSYIRRKVWNCMSRDLGRGLLALVRTYCFGYALGWSKFNSGAWHLYASFEEEPGFFQFATAIISNDVEEVQKFLDQAVDASCEGLIIKTLNEDATYEPSKRSLNWLKLKKDYMENIGDSLDLVPIAAFHGRGKRTGTGFSEEMLEERSASLRSKVIPKPKAYYTYAETINPDVWFETSEVWEVKAADLTISPVYRAAVGIVDPNKGISLRFPRLLRVRPDKTPEEASSSEQVADMYNAQKHNNSNNQDGDEDD